MYYSKDSLQYLVSKNKNLWHKHTWYYGDYKWINENITLKNNEKIMVFSSAQLTYYLRKKYINIDPLSGYFKETEIFKTILKYEDEIIKHNIAYVFVDYDNLDKRNKKMINEMVSRGSITVIRNSNTFISSSRLFDHGSFHKTILYKVNI